MTNSQAYVAPPPDPVVEAYLASVTARNLEFLAWLYDGLQPVEMEELPPFGGALFEEALDASYLQLPRRDRYDPEVGDPYLNLGLSLHKALAPNWPEPGSGIPEIEEDQEEEAA